MRDIRRRSRPDDTLEEFQEHIDRRAADLMRAGLGEAEARRRARLEFGGVESYKEACREARQTRTARVLAIADQLWREGGVAVRRLWATPAFTTFAAASLALGLGLTTAVYSTIGAFVWRASSVPDADRLAVLVTRPASLGVARWAISTPDFRDLRSQVRSVPALAASSLTSGILNDGTRTSAFLGQAVTGNYFAIVRLPLYLGRGIGDADDRPGADPVVVLSHDFWQSKTGGDPGIVGRTVRVGGHPFVAIGVAAESVDGARDLLGQQGPVDADCWIPLTDKPLVTDYLPTGRDEPNMVVVARVPAGTTVQTVATEVGGIGAALDRTAPIGGSSAGPAPAARSWSVTTAAAIARESAFGAMGKAGGALVLLVSLVLVVACTNIANLTLGRGASRMHEFAVRRALGASRGRLIREQCAESVVLAAVGGFGAFLVARMLCQYLTTDIPTGRPFDLIAVHPKLGASPLLAAGGSLLMSLVVFGVAPALQLTRVSLRERLAGDAAGAPPARWKGRRLLIAGQVVISTAFILLAAASTRAVTAEVFYDPGFDLQHLAVGAVSLRPLHGDAALAHRVIAALGVAARAQPGFESVAITAGLPMGSAGFQQIAHISSVDQPMVQLTDLSSVVVIPATPGIFRTLGVPILRGRAFDDHDTAATHPVIVTSELAARQVFGTTDVVGRQMSYQGPSDTTPTTVDVIGVTRDTDTERFFGQPLPFGSVYVPLAQHDPLTVIIVGRTAGDPAPMPRTFAGIVRQADPDLAVRFASTGEKAMTPAYVILRAAARLSGGLSILAVTLAMLGLYGVLSHLVARRTREIGLRLALGAEPSRVRRMIVGEGLRPVVWGLGVGMFVGVGARVVFRATGLASNISALDPPAFAVAAVILVTAGLAACYVPARRASNVDPNAALRDL